MVGKGGSWPECGQVPGFGLYLQSGLAGSPVSLFGSGFAFSWLKTAAFLGVGGWGGGPGQAAECCVTLGQPFDLSGLQPPTPTFPVSFSEE